MAFIGLRQKIKLAWLKATLKNISWGQNVTVDVNTSIINMGNAIRIGDNVYLRSISRGYQAGMPFSTTLLTDVPGATIIIGNNARINGAYIHAQQSISIGSNCVIASGVNILDTNGHELYSTDRTKKRDTPAPVSIGNNVWVGLNAIILKGTTIGDNSVVSAGSVVKGEFPANSLIMGNPAQVVKTLDIVQSDANKFNSSL
jgi:acetyltransferase-like isoleucine patch superfamily enzyme